MILASLLGAATALPLPLENVRPIALERYWTSSGFPTIVPHYIPLKKEKPFYRTDQSTATLLYTSDRGARSRASANVSGSTVRLDTSHLRGPWDKVFELYRDYFIKEPRLSKRSYEEIIYHGRSSSAAQRVIDIWTRMRFKKVKVTNQQYRQTVAKYRYAASQPAQTRSMPKSKVLPYYKRIWQKLSPGYSTKGAGVRLVYRQVAAHYAR